MTKNYISNPALNYNLIRNEMIQHALHNAIAGDPESVIKTIDDYCWKQAPFSINVGDVKGNILDQWFKESDPMIAVEIGSYVGYSAVRMARLLQPGGKLYCIEVDPIGAKLMEQLVEFAGLSDKVTILIGSSEEKIACLIAEHKIDKIDFIFLDHEGACYLPDLKRIIDHGLLRAGSVIAADNIVYPDALDYAEYVRDHPKFQSSISESHNSYRKDIQDGIGKAVYLG